LGILKLKHSGQATDASQLTSIFNLDLLRNMIEASKPLPLWHLRLIFLIGVSFFKNGFYLHTAKIFDS
jgi:hypothetical protein